MLEKLNWFATLHRKGEPKGYCRWAGTWVDHLDKCPKEGYKQAGDLFMESLNIKKRLAWGNDGGANS